MIDFIKEAGIPYIVGIVCGLMFAAISSSSNMEWHQTLIKRGVMEYNQTTGAIQWVADRKTDDIDKAQLDAMEHKFPTVAEKEAAKIKPANKPEVKYDRRVVDMVPGETGYCVPWAYDPLDGTIDGSYGIHSRPGGTVQMKVSMTDSGPVLDIPPDYKYWRPSERIRAMIMSETKP